MSAMDIVARGIAVSGRTGNAANLRRIRQLMTTAGRNRFKPYPASPLTPTVTSTNLVASNMTAATVNGTAYPWNTPQYLWNGGAISYIGTTPVADANTTAISTLGGAVGGMAAHVNYGHANREANPYRIRFMTNAPGFLLHIVNQAGVETRPVMLIDGEQITYPANAGFIARNTGYGRDFLSFQFDTIAATIELGSAPIGSGGTGYAIGDIITVPSAGGTPATLVVRAITSGGVVSVVGYNSRGTFTAAPTGTIATTSSGAGTGFTLTTPLMRKSRSVTMRTVELYVSQYFELRGVSVGANYDVFPVAASGPRILWFGDSFTEGSAPDDPANIWHAVAARRLGIDDSWCSGVGSTGFTVDGPSPRVRFGGRIADITDFAPDIVVVPGSVNDNIGAAAAITAAVTSFWLAVRAANPNALLVALDPWNSPSNPTNQAHYQAHRDGVAAANIAGANVQMVQTQAWYPNGMAAWHGGGRHHAPRTAGPSMVWLPGRRGGPPDHEPGLTEDQE